MAAEIPQFNSAGANGLTALYPLNSQMGGWLASSGNAVSVDVQGLGVKETAWSSPGAHWTARRVSGYEPRLVTWDWLVAATNQGNLNNVEAAIEAYIADGREYTLVDGKGRTSLYAVMLGRRAGTTRIGRRVTYSDGRKAQHWRLAFMVLYPQVGAAVI